MVIRKTRSRVNGKPSPDTGVAELLKDVPRMIKREFVRIGYYLPRAIGLLILFFIPGIGQTVAPVLWFLFGAWMMSIQYCDYPFDNHRVGFNEMKQALAKERMRNVQFGGVISLLMMVPLST